jgi:hypothetical protein
MYKAAIVPVVLYGCETCTLTLREEHRLKMSENRELRRISVPNRERKQWEAGEGCVMRSVVCFILLW